MAFVPTCQYDIFISYAQVNNVPSAGVDHGWVTYFEKELKTKVEERLGRIGAVEVFIDYKRLSPGDEITPYIMNAVKNSAILIVILSDGYLKSDWCVRERNKFLELIKKRSSTSSSWSQSIKRIFVVDYDDIPAEDRPAELKEIFPPKFWVEDEKGVKTTLGWPKPDPYKPEYYTRIKQLSDKVAKILKKLKKLAEDNGWTVDDDEAEAIKKTITEPTITYEDDWNLLVDSPDSDSDLRKRICDLASQHGFGYTVIHGNKNKAGENRTEREKKAKTYGGIIIIYEKCTKDQIDLTINEYKKILPFRRTPLSFKGRALVLGPPPGTEKDLPDNMLPHMMRIICSRKLNKSKLEEFFEKLEKELKMKQ